MLAAAIGSREERVFSVQRDGPDRALDDVGVKIDAAVSRKRVRRCRRDSA
jgi:hypothetical protein